MVYREALNVGYRYFCTARVPVAFPFGHGLTYSTFQYSELTLSAASIAPGQSLTVSLTLRNTGTVAAAEVVQLYVRDVEASAYRPDRELRAFDKVQLAAGASQLVLLELGPRSLAMYHLGRTDWYVEPGRYELLVGASCEDIRSSATLTVTGSNAQPAAYSSPRPEEATTLLDDAALSALGLVVPPEAPPAPITKFSTLEEVRASSAFGGLLVQLMVIGAKGAARSGAAAGLGADPDAAVAVTVGGLLGSSFGSLQLMTGGKLPEQLVDALVYMLNGRLASALLRLFGCAPTGDASRLGGPAQSQ